MCAGFLWGFEGGRALCGWHLPGWRCRRDAESEGLWALCSSPPQLGPSVTFQRVKSGVAFLSISPDGYNRPRSCGAADYRGDISAKQGCDAGVCRPECRAPAPSRVPVPHIPVCCFASSDSSPPRRRIGQGEGSCVSHPLMRQRLDASSVCEERPRRARPVLRPSGSSAPRTSELLSTSLPGSRSSSGDAEGSMRTHPACPLHPSCLLDCHSSTEAQRGARRSLRPTETWLPSLLCPPASLSPQAGKTPRCSCQNAVWIVL